MSPACINDTYIVLIPKIKDPQTPMDFWPISLCNVIFKIIRKTIANRLKHILPNIIHESQSTFVPDRQILDNALLALEIFHAMKNRKKGSKGIFALKLDMSKAYDRVEWLFLEKIMEKMRFPPRMINLIMSCVSSISYSILTNGTPGDFFSPSRGLR